AAYPASNILIISDRASNVNRMMRIIRRIDQVGDQDVEIFPLQNAAAGEIVRVINALYQGQAAAEAGLATKVVADERSNSVVISAPPKIMRSIMGIIDKLDIRRPQVLVEAVIADVDVTRNAELGVNWAAFSKGSNVPAGAFVSPVGGTSIVDLANAAQNPNN